MEIIKYELFGELTCGAYLADSSFDDFGGEQAFLSGGRKVVISFASLPSRIDFLDKIVDALASLIVDIFPERANAKSSPAWFEQARRMILRGTPPVLDVPYEQNIRELSLLIGDGLVIMLVINCERPGDSDVDFFMSKARWLAVCANAVVIAAFSAQKSGFSGDNVFSNITDPNFFSIAERLLWERMQNDETLAGKFLINMPFRTILGSEIMPDFFCSEIMLSVEVDGYTYHCGKNHFANDRQRDYEMLLSRCTTLRITAKEILTDIEGAVCKVRNVFHFLKNRGND